MSKRLKVLFVSTEVTPYAKAGGLADIAGALPPVLKEMGLDIRVIMPKYKGIDIEADQTLLNNSVPLYFIENDSYYKREYIYSTPEGDYPDNMERFAYFCKEILKRIKREGFKPDIIHANDWETALIPVYLKTTYKDDEFFKDVKTVFTIHNLAYQGIFQASEWDKTELNPDIFNLQGLEYYKKINLMKGALIFADYITTVSPRYAEEIQGDEYGFGLQNVLSSRKESISGIINGIDYLYWDSENDSQIPQNFTINSLNKKPINKQHIQTEMGMEIGRDIPLIAAIGRLTDQKGWDLIVESIDKICEKDLQLIVLGEGEKKYQDIMTEISKKYPLKTSINIKFDLALAKKIYAAADIFLMPSKFEPCGLGQLISYRYATLPLGRETGGLADTITDYTKDKAHGTGFLFKNYKSKDLVDAIERALDVYRDRRAWRNIQKRVVKADYSWKHSAKDYKNLYKNVIKSLKRDV
ncbi:MAG: glycogen synthase GlgA [Candidatus Kaelpia imicola]|nr:glycogen synthase GlgA [Candidatus Kaelpia imicola]